MFAGVSLIRPATVVLPAHQERASMCHLTLQGSSREGRPMRTWACAKVASKNWLLLFAISLPTNVLEHLRNRCSRTQHACTKRMHLLRPRTLIRIALVLMQPSARSGLERRMRRLGSRCPTTTTPPGDALRRTDFTGSGVSNSATNSLDHQKTARHTHFVFLSVGRRKRQGRSGLTPNGTASQATPMAGSTPLPVQARADAASLQFRQKAMGLPEARSCGGGH